jgi:hypothetical protein
MYQVGAGQVIKGWDEGFLDMKIGSKRILMIPPNVRASFHTFCVSICIHILWLEIALVFMC